MWKCHKCGKPVYFAERKQSLGYDWHPECLRCEECGKRLNPGQHAEHKGVPYCHVPCYGALFGPQLFGHGTRVESHKSFGQQKESSKTGTGPQLPRAHVETKLKQYNQYYDGRSAEIKSREVNGRLILEGSLRIHWGVQGVIHLKENDDQRTVVTIRKRNSRLSSDFESDDDVPDISRDSSCNDISNSSIEKDSSIFFDVETDGSCTEGSTSLADISTSDSSLISASSSSPNHENLHKSVTLPSKLNLKDMEWDELDELLQVERKVDESFKLYQTMPVPLPSQSSVDSSSSTLSSNDSTKQESTESNIFSNQDGANPQQKIKTDPDAVPSNTNDNWIEHSNHLNRSLSGPDCLERIRDPHSPVSDQLSLTNSDYSNIETSEEVVLRRPAKTGSTAIKRRSGKRRSRAKIKRRCSINGHFYDRETSFFTPPHGSQMSVWVTSLVNTQEVINLMLEKYKVDSDSKNFALFVVRENGEQRRLKDDEYPLLTRVLLGPHEEITRLFLMDSNTTSEVSNEVAQFLNLSLAECRAILNQYYTIEEKEIVRIREKYDEMKRRIKQRMEELKVRIKLN